MKKVAMFLICISVVACLAACEKKVDLHCDGEGCNNMVTVKGEADESRVVYCKECRDNQLAD